MSPSKQKPMYEAGSSEHLPSSMRVVRAIQHLIRIEKLTPGQRLPAQRDLASRLAISRASLREGLSTLEALGLVCTEHGRGSFILDGAIEGIAPANWRFSNLYELKDVYQFRYTIEPSAGRLAALKVSDEELVAISQVHERFKSATQSRDLVLSTGYNVEFHRMIIASSKNAVFMDVYDKFQKIFSETQILPFLPHAKQWSAAMEHGKILEALSRRDPDGVAYYMSMHLVRATERIGISLDIL